MAAPGPIPALPDTERQSSYVATASAGPFNVGFAIYGDGADFGNWLSVQVNGVEKTAVTEWTLTSPSGSVATLARPISNAQVTFISAQTGTVTITGARRPRRTSQFAENRGVAARDLNQALTDIIAMLRETWDGKLANLNRSLRVPSGETVTELPSAALRAGTVISFDGNGALINAPLPLGGGISFAFSTNTGVAAPNSGKLKANSTTFALINTLYISNFDRLGSLVASLIDAWDDSNNTGTKGWLFIENVADPTAWAAFNISGAIAINGTSRSVPVQPIASSNYPFITASLITVAFAPSGEQGAPGNGTGDTVGPAGAVGGNIPLFNGATGKILKDSGISLSSIRIRLTGNTTFHVATTGNDTTGDGTLSTPWATPVGAYNNLQSHYDLAGFQVTIQIHGGPYLISNQMGGPLVGYRGTNGSGCIFRGDGSGSTLIKPPHYLDPGGGYCFSAIAQAEFGLAALKCDGLTAGIDQIVVGRGGVIGIYDDFVFGNAIYGPGGCNDMSAQNGFLYFDTDYRIDKDQVVTTGDVTSGDNTIINLASMTGLQLYMGVRGNGIPAGAFIGAISGSTVTLGYVAGAPAITPTVGGTGVTLAFDYGAQCHLLLGDGADCYYNTNGDPAINFTITVNGNPMYTSAFFQGYLGPSMNAQGLRFLPSAATGGGGGSGNCVPFRVQRRGVIDTNYQGHPYFPGKVGNTAVTTITTTVGSKSATLAANNGVFVGNVPAVYRKTTTSFSSGASTFVVASATGIRVGDKVVGTGIRPATVVTGISGTTITLSAATANASGGTIDVWFVNTQTSSLIVFAPGTFIEGVSGTAVTLSKAATGAVTAEPVYCAGFVDTDGLYA